MNSMIAALPLKNSPDLILRQIFSCREICFRRHVPAILVPKTTFHPRQHNIKHLPESKLELPKMSETQETKSIATHDAISHHVMYGAKGELPTKRTVAGDWGDPGPLLKPKTASWNQIVSKEDVTKLLNGFLPADMDDKWFVYADGPDTQGKAVIHMYRSWTSDHIVEVTLMLEMDEDGEIAEKDARITGIAWTDDRQVYSDEMTEEEAKEIAREVCAWCMDVILSAASTAISNNN
jgi:hypothetical protein